MTLTRKRFSDREVPREIRGCLRALGVPFRRDVSFWLANEAELEWILRDAHRAWREKIKIVHTDRGGTQQAAAALNAIWQRIQKAFLWHGVALKESALTRSQEYFDVGKERERLRKRRKKQFR